MSDFAPGQVWVGRGGDPEHRKVIAVRGAVIRYAFRRGRAGRYSSAVLEATAASFGRAGFKPKAER